MLDIKALEKQQKSILSEVQAALKGGAFEKKLNERPAALHEARRATLLKRVEALEAEKQALTERIDGEIAVLRSEVAQVEDVLKAARPGAEPKVRGKKS